MEIKILGTVSPYCKDDKNCPGYLVRSSESKILLDCGPGISRNLNMAEDLENLNIIISHLHKDHYGDLLSIGYASYVFHNLGYLNEKVKVYIPEKDYKKISESYIDKDSWGASRTINKTLPDYTFLQEFGDEHFLEFETYNEHSKLKIGDLSVDFSKNPHQINTFSTRIVEKDKIFVYGADTGYEKNTLTELAKNADILLCESTFLRGQQKVGDNHLYASEAAKIAYDANVRQLILTHFFPEIEKFLYVEEASKIFSNVEAAEENKVLKLGGIYGKKFN